MNTFKRKALFTAVLAGLGAAGTAEAVYLSPNNTGQVLVYPYYTVQAANGNAWNTYISVVNTTSLAKAIKVRVLEGKTSSEVLDFNLYLSPNDVWTAAIIPADATATGPGQLITADRSCTGPAINATNGTFRNYQYAAGTGGVNLPGVGLDRTREGYIEMLEMGTLSGVPAAAVTHNSAGIPANCPLVQDSSFIPAAGTINPPGGGLMGTGTLINVNSGQDAGYKADALDAWSEITQFSVTSLTLPNLGSASPTTSLVINAGGLLALGAASQRATAYLTAFNTVSGTTGGARAVASVYMHTNVLNEYILDSATQSNTDWVITQPLKNLFVSSTTAATPYTAVLTSSGACETIGFSYFNREELAAASTPGDFSPPPPIGAPNSLCWESNVLSIRNGAAHMPTSLTVSGVLGSVNVTNVALASTAFQNGWANLNFSGTNATFPIGMAGSDPAFSSHVSLDQTGAAVIPPPVLGAVTFFGLPVTGFMIRNFRNGTLSCTNAGGATAACQGNYGSLFSHSYRNLITP
jgi:hypothetical protein